MAHLYYSLSANTNSESIAESFTSVESQVPYLAPCKQQENKKEQWRPELLAFASHLAEDFSGQAVKAESHLECSAKRKTFILFTVLPGWYMCSHSASKDL